MSETVVIQMDELKRLTSRLFEIMEQRGRTQIPVTDGQYWTVFFSEAFGLDEPKPTMGDVINDLADARAELGGDSGDTIVWHASSHLAGLFQLIAYADCNGKSNNITSEFRP